MYLCNSCGKEITELENLVFDGFCSECSCGEQIEFIAVGKGTTNDLICKLNNLMEAASENSADAGGSYNQCMYEYKESIKDLLCFLDIDTKCDIIETNNINYFSPYRIVLKDRK